MSTNVSTTTCITQIIQNINYKLNMKDINKILATTHFKCKYKKKMIRRNNTFSWKHVSLKLLEGFHFSLVFSDGDVKSPRFLGSLVSSDV
jgi:hypothetical protein